MESAGHPHAVPRVSVPVPQSLTIRIVDPRPTGRSGPKVPVATHSAPSTREQAPRKATNLVNGPLNAHSASDSHHVAGRQK